MAPSGLDGNLRPITSPQRDGLLSDLASEIRRSSLGGRVCVGIDGAPGSGKSTFADELAEALRGLGVPSVRSTTDSFHRPQIERYERGRASAEGYYRDSHDLDSIRRELLDPFVAGRAFRTAVFDEPTDSPATSEWQSSELGAVLLFDGIFVHRPELRSYWNQSIYLRAPVRMAQELSRVAERIPDQFSEYVARYVDGWSLYESECSPQTCATWVIDNDDFASPRHGQD